MNIEKLSKGKIKSNKKVRLERRQDKQFEELMKSFAQASNFTKKMSDITKEWNETSDTHIQLYRDFLSE